MSASGKANLCDKQYCSTNLTAILDISEEMDKMVNLSRSLLKTFNSALFRAPYSNSAHVTLVLCTSARHRTRLYLIARFALKCLLQIGYSCKLQSEYWYHTTIYSFLYFPCLFPKFSCVNIIIFPYPCR